MKKADTCRIHLLDMHTANQIAAGEVAERPASVVKELTENAIDAGATKITVRLYDQRCEKIRVVDNGAGMSAPELRLAVQRHATSKIRKAADLDTLSTLGFRGEALPSIAAVSRLTIISRQQESDIAYTVKVEDGKASIPEACAAAAGTTVLVEDLFYNAPARRKFLKSPRTELGLISDLIGKLAVAYPHIAFTLINGNHRLIVTDGSGEASRAVLAVYGRDTLLELLEISAEQPFPISGFVSKPSLNRSNRNGYSFFVNSRSVRSRELTLAVDEAYATLLPKDRYAQAILFLTLPPDSVDVNVHPAKLEVKFRDNTAIRQAVVGAIKNTLLKNMDALPHLSMLAPKPIDIQPAAPLPTSGSCLPYDIRASLAERRQLQGVDLYRALHRGDYSGNIIRDQVMSLEEIEKLLEKADADEAGVVPHQTTIEDTPQKKRIYSRLHPLGQLAGAFIVAAGDRELYLIDQHAAAERVNYERIAKRAREQEGDDSAMLALPLPLSLSPSDAAIITDMMLRLRELGFILEHFGDNSYVIRGVPAWYDGSDAEGLLRDVLELLKEGGDTLGLHKEKLFAVACKQSVKANRYLSPPQISSLLLELDDCENSATCPHGRPIACIITVDEIRKRFLRSGI